MEWPKIKTMQTQEWKNDTIDRRLFDDIKLQTIQYCPAFGKTTNFTI